MPELRFSATGIEGVDYALTQVQERMKNLDPAWDEIVELYVKSEEDWFASRGEGEWPPLSHSYEEWKAKHYPGEPMLVRTGHMLSTITPPSVENRGVDYIELGTDDPVAREHQTGAGRLPRRVVVNLTDEEKDQIIEILRRHLMGETNG